MKKISLLLFFFSSIALHQVFAQPSFYLSPTQVVVDEGDQVCLTMGTLDFTNILDVQFTIRFDPGVLELLPGPNGIKNFNPAWTGLDLADFDLSQVDQGIILLNWSSGQPCELASSPGVSFPDNMVDPVPVFELCFLATAEYGYHTPVEITDDPLDIVVKRQNANCLNIGVMNIVNGFISIGTPPLTINISSADGYNGDIACVNFKVRDFANIVSFQYPIRWDSTKLTFVSASTSNLPGFTNSAQNLNLATSGTMIASWYTNELDGISLANGTSILELCFEINGSCGQYSPIYIDDYPGAPIEVINLVTSDTSSGVDIGIVDQPGEVSINCFSPNGITVNIEDKDVCPGEDFFVDVSVKDFDNIKIAQFSLKWNKTVIQFLDITYPNTQPTCSPFSPFVFTASDSLALNWTNQASGGCNLPDDFKLFRLHFKAIGASGSNTTIAVANPILVDKFGGQVVDVGINNYNGLVSICELSSPTIKISSIDGNPGDTVCLNFTVQDFDAIRRMQYTINWESSILQFVEVKNMNLPGMNAFNFYTAQAQSLGVLGVEWENLPSVTRPDGTIIFSLCFKIIGDPGECTGVSFTDFPYPTDIRTDESNNTNVGLNGQPGQVCVDNPLSFVVSLPDIITGPGAMVCMDLTVDKFIQLTQMQYSINWNPAILEFDHVQPTGALANFNAGSYDASPGLVTNGNLVINWASGNQLQGTTVPNGTSIFQICFIVVGPPNSCTGVEVSGSPTQIEIKTAPTGNANLGLTANQGSACVSATISIQDFLVEQVDCPSIPSGAIDITVVGGSGNYSYQWTGPNANPNTEDQTNLLPGNYAVTVVDVQNPGLTVQEQFTVALSPNAPIASAGQDTTFSCGSFFMTLNGSGSSSGPNIAYNWIAIGNGLILPGEENKMNPKIIGGSLYQLTVTDLNTGCSATDQVHLNAAVIPFPEAGEAQMLTCENDTLPLDGTASPFGFEVEWTSSPGGHLVPGTEHNLIALATAPGEYYLTLSNSQTGCFGVDTVVVNADIQAPVADAGAQGNLGCNDTDTQLDGSGSSAGSEYSYEWSVVSGGQICGNANDLQSMACAPGVYQIKVTNTLNGCTAVDDVEIVGDTLKPTALAGPAKEINCIDTLVVLNGSGSAGNGNFSYSWSSQNGGSFVDGQNTLTPTVNAPGTYILTVTNDDNGCSSISNVMVANNQVYPISVDSVDHPLTCEFLTATLNGNGSSTGSIYTYSWEDAGGMQVGTGLTATVSTPGVYTLFVKNTQNGCVQPSDGVEVADLQALPVVNAGDTAFINCLGPATLNGLIDAGNPNLIYQWSGPVGNCLTNPASLNPVANCEGTYFLTVLDTFTNCLAKDSVLVQNGEILPVISAGADTLLTCSNAAIVLDGSSNESDITVQWESVPIGAAITDPNTLNPTITIPTTYLLTVTSNFSGCSSTSLVAVAADTTAPVADAGANATIDCQQTVANLSAAGSTLTGTTVLWEALSGTIDPGQANLVDITVGEEGAYQLTVTSNANGCSSTDIATVTNIAEIPTVSVPATVEMGCSDEFVLLDGTGSTTGPDITYLWVNENQDVLGNAITTQASGPGIFTLFVFNAANSCEASSEVEVIQIVDGEAAKAMIDADDCSVEAMLLGNLPAGTIGLWTSPTGAAIEDAAAGTTLATGLQSGNNQFIWTLSKGFCENYSSDTVSVTLNQSLPQAQDDQATLAGGIGGIINVNVLENDEANGAGFTFNLVGGVNTIGQATAGAAFGSIDYIKEKCFVGEVAIPYEICSETCPGLCDTANLIIKVEQDESEDCDDVPNAITPNGDGMNDAFVFDILLNNPPNAFPDNEMVIFNRWGDEVFHAKPYLNDWRGTNNKGKDLPQGTYYYILRLNIEDGEIIQGDVTILK
ncbi:MAG: gliding motility-associated C-terminal domain-containing protein [Saprospiraceae bacterium]